MGRLTVSDIINYSIEYGAKKTLLKLSNTNSKGLSAAELKPYIKRMDEDEAEESVENLIKSFMKRGSDHKPGLDYWWFGADEEDLGLGGGRRRRRKRTRRKKKSKRRRRKKTRTKKKRRRRRRK